MAPSTLTVPAAVRSRLLAGLTRNVFVLGATSFFTDVGSDLETYGRTCGGRVGDESRIGGQCQEEFG